MAIDLAALPALEKRPLRIRHMAHPQMLAEWSRILGRGFEMPPEMASAFSAIVESLGTDLPFRHYLGYLDDRPVATTTLFLGAGVAGIYNVATVAEARNQGVASAMMLLALSEARDLGYQAGILHSSAMGYRVYERLGFQKLCQMDHFYWQAPGA